MIPIGKTIVSELLFKKFFNCDLTACKGVCCVEGEAGAPLEEKELKKLLDNYDTIKPFLRKEGIKAIEEDGLFKTVNGEHETTLVKGKECVYVIFDEKGIAKCGIEEAYSHGKSTWQKPISCHLYPVRVTQYQNFTAVNYHSWKICDDACVLGEELQVPVYQFVKNALIRKFGKEWYFELEKGAEKIEATKNNS